jgi:hypothetical protein
MQQVTGQDGQKTLIICLIGAAIVTAIWFAISMDIVTTLVFGLPIGVIGTLIVYRSFVRIREERSTPAAPAVQTPANGKQPSAKSEDVKATTPLKLK